MASFYDFTVSKRDGSDYKLAELKDKVVLVVNTATGCGFTPQYEGLERLYELYHEEGLEILDFPCNQFGHQAPGSDEEIHEFCTGRYKTQFDQMAKIEVNGDNAAPLYQWLTAQKGGKIKWNFTKFLVNRQGEIVKRYGSIVKPEKIEKDIKELL
ncbi:glutathione peroxidase [Candidatus Saccharibacteria bacterium]|nr:glutathione peroxidase [Candidatus Saccharibacteria bacterium]